MADAGSAASTSYSYRVRARDTGGAGGRHSNVASATTGSTPPPPSATLVAGYASTRRGGNLGRRLRQRKRRHVAGRDVDDRRQVRLSPVVQRDDRQGPDPRHRLARSDHGGDPQAWVNPAVTQSGWRAIVQKRSTPTCCTRAAPRGRSDPPPESRRAPRADGLGPSALPAGTWSHLAMTYDGANIRRYVTGRRSRASPSPDRSRRRTRRSDRRQQPTTRTSTAASTRSASTARLTQPEILTDMQNRSFRIRTRRAGRQCPCASLDDRRRHGEGLVQYDRRSPGSTTCHFQVDGPRQDRPDPRRDLRPYRVHVYYMLNGWLVRADHTKIAGSDAVPIHFSNVVDPAGPTPPTASIMRVGERQLRDGRGQCQCDRRVGVYGVQFKLDGALLGVEDPAAPYSVNWATNTSGNGPHVPTATPRCRGERDDRGARDGDGLQQRLGSRAGRAKWSARRRSRSSPCTRTCSRTGSCDLRQRDQQRDQPRVWTPARAPSPRCPTTTRQTCSAPAIRRSPMAGSSSSAATRTATS